MSRTGLLGASLVLATLAACAVALLAVPGKPAEAAFPGKNGKIAFSYDDRIYAVRPDGGGLRPLTPWWLFAWSPQWSPGGKHFLFLRDSHEWHDSEIYIARADGFGRAMLTDTQTAYEHFPQWYPSGRKIVYCAAPTQEEYGEFWRSGDYEIYSLRLDRKKRPIGPPVQLTDNDSYDCPHSVSPDGEKMAFVSDREGDDEEVYVLGAAEPEGPSNPATRLTDNADDYRSAPDWSPNGKKIAYTGSDEETNSFETDVFVMNADGTAKRNLTDGAGVSGGYPAWSPNGKKITFVRTFAEVGELWKMRTDGTGASRVTSSQWWSPDWQPSP